MIPWSTQETTMTTIIKQHFMNLKNMNTTTTVVHQLKRKSKKTEEDMDN